MDKCFTINCFIRKQEAKGYKIFVQKYQTDG